MACFGGARTSVSKVPGSADAVLEQGWAEKRGEGILGAAFKKRWFVLDSEHVLYFKKQWSVGSSLLPQGAICVRGAEVSVVDPKPGQTSRFELQVKDAKVGRTFILACESAEDQKRWAESIKKAAAAGPNQVIDTHS